MQQVALQDKQVNSRWCWSWGVASGPAWACLRWSQRWQGRICWWCLCQSSFSWHSLTNLRGGCNKNCRGTLFKPFQLLSQPNIRCVYLCHHCFQLRRVCTFLHTGLQLMWDWISKHNVCLEWTASTCLNMHSTKHDVELTTDVYRRSHARMVMIMCGGSIRM